MRDRGAGAGPRRRRWRRSLHARLLLVFLLLAATIAAVFLGGVQRVVRGGWEAYAKPLVRDYADRIAADLGTPPERQRAEAIVARLPLTLRIEGPALNWSSHPERHRRGRYGSDGFSGGDLDDGGLVRRTADGHRVVIGLAEPTAAWRSRAFGWLTLAALLLLTGAAWAWVRRLLRPLDDIRVGAERFGRGDFGTPIPERRHDELGDLAGRINTMAASLHGMLDAKRALLLAISHELRGPLTRARVNAELVDTSPARDALLRDLAEMRDLITDLLESERLAGGHAALQLEAVDVGALLREAVAARTGGDAVTLSVDPAVGTWRLDPTRIGLLLRNLLDNARRHAGGAASAPELSASAEGETDGDVLRIRLRDYGPGVPADQLPRLAEAFWRPDSARSRDAGGVGLGLYLCRLVAEAHGGRLEFARAEPGLDAVVTLPRR